MELSLDTLFWRVYQRLMSTKINVTDSVTLPMPVQGCQATDVAEHQFNDKSCSQVIQNINLPKYKDYIVDNGLMY